MQSAQYPNTSTTWFGWVKPCGRRPRAPTPRLHPPRSRRSGRSCGRSGGGGECRACRRGTGSRPPAAASRLRPRSRDRRAPDRRSQGRSPTGVPHGGVQACALTKPSVAPRASRTASRCHVLRFMPQLFIARLRASATGQAADHVDEERDRRDVRADRQRSLPSASRMPPTSETTANTHAEHAARATGEDETRRAAAAGRHEDREHEQRADDLDRDGDGETEQHHEDDGERADRHAARRRRPRGRRWRTSAGARSQQQSDHDDGADRRRAHPSCGVVDRDDLPGEQAELVRRCGPGTARGTGCRGRGRTA